MVNFKALGQNPQGDDLLLLQQSKNYNSQYQSFVNRLENLVPDMQKNMKFFDMTKKFLFNKAVSKPTDKLPQEAPNLLQFVKKDQQFKFIWLGHSSFLVNLSGIILLIDPVFSENAAPVSFFGKRFQEPPLKLEQLPVIDYIVISHDHYDHLDYESVIYFRHKKTKFITPLGVGSHLRAWQIEPQRIVELDWWQQIQFDDIKFICTPAQHFSGRTASANKTLWASWVVQSKEYNFYYSGDTGYDIHFKEIGQKYGPFDIAFIENGQYNPMWHAVHLLPNEGAQAYKDLRAKLYVPVHWGMFNLALHNWYDPIEAISDLAQKHHINLVTPKLGQLIELPKPTTPTNNWWKNYITHKTGI